jgi:hypothetical protein
VKNFNEGIKIRKAHIMIMVGCFVMILLFRKSRYFLVKTKKASPSKEKLLIGY